MFIFPRPSDVQYNRVEVKKVSEAAEISIEDIKALIARRMGPDRVPNRFNIISDTSDFFRVEYDDVVVLDNNLYWIKR